MTINPTGTTKPTASTPARSGRTTWPVLVAAAVASLAGCGSGVKEVAADDPAFTGLSPAVVQEALDLPYFDDWPGPDAYDIQDAYNADIASRAYLIQVCRDYLNVYQEWTRTGQQPAPPTPPQTDWEGRGFGLGDIGRQAYDSGDPAQLLDFVAGPEACGDWVPVTPGSDQTIEVFLFGRQIPDPYEIADMSQPPTSAPSISAP